MPTSTDIDRLVSCLDKLPPVSNKRTVLFENPPLKLLDCVLSLNRRYDGFVVPRVTKFKNNHPEVDNLSRLCQCVAQSGGPDSFFEVELKYDYPDAAEMFGRVLDYLFNEVGNYPGNTEMEKCHKWAINVKVDGYKNLYHGNNIPLFGIAGWQYLRMLFGADTCKPDIAVKRYLHKCFGRNISNPNAVSLMEAAAKVTPSLKQYPKPVREADHRIWHQYNMNKPTKQACH